MLEELRRRSTASLLGTPPAGNWRSYNVFRMAFTNWSSLSPMHPMSAWSPLAPATSNSTPSRMTLLLRLGRPTEKRLPCQAQTARGLRLRSSLSKRRRAQNGLLGLGMGFVDFLGKTPNTSSSSCHLPMTSRSYRVSRSWTVHVTRLTTDVEPYMGLSIAADRRTVVTARTPTRISIWVGTSNAQAGRELVSSLYWPRTNASGARVGWSGNRLLITEYSRGRPAVTTILPDGTRTRTIEDATDGLGTPDGRFVVFTKSDGIWRSDLDGRNHYRLSAEPAQPEWITPNGDVLFVSKESGLQAPWRVNVAGGSPVQVTNTFALARSLAVSADARRLAFATPRDNGRALVICDLPGLQTERRPMPLRGGLYGGHPMEREWLTLTRAQKQTSG